MDPTEAGDAYARNLGDRVTVRRGEGDTMVSASDIPARIHDLKPDELRQGSGIRQLVGKAIVLHSALAAAGFPLPLKIGDRLTQPGHVWTITATDDVTRRVGATVIAWSLEIRGN